MRSDLLTAYGIVNDFVMTEYTSNYTPIVTTSNENNEVKSETPLSTEIHKIIDSTNILNDQDASVGISANITTEGIIYETNINRRSAAGLLPLTENSKLDLSAKEKVEDMFAKQYFEHVSPSGVRVSDLADNVSYEFIIIGENLALGEFKNSEAVLVAWMNSPDHRANILNTKYKEIGAYAEKGLYNGKEVWLAVQHFGLPKDNCPTINQKLKDKITNNQNRITKLQRELSLKKESIDNGGDSANVQTLIDSYNIEVIRYNKLIASNKIDVELYNKSVTAFNSCVQSNT